MKVQNSQKLPHIHAKLYCNANEKNLTWKGLLTEDLLFLQHFFFFENFPLFSAYNTLEPQEDSTGLKGCLKSFILDGHPLHFASAIESLHVTTACPLSSSERNQ